MFFNLASKSVFVIKLVISGILFSTAVNAQAAAKPLTSGILSSTAVSSVFIIWWKVFTHFIRSFLSIQLLNDLSYPFHLTYILSPFLLITFSILNSS